jgi:glycosyltransferase involved in cell wall biosynthesis
MRAWSLATVIAADYALDVVILGDATQVDADILRQRLQAESVVAVPVRARPWSTGQRLRWVLGSRLPRELSGLDIGHRHTRDQRCRIRTYEVALFVKPLAYAMLGGVLKSRMVIVDIDDVSDEMLTRLAATRRGNDRSAGTLIGRWLRAWFVHIDIERWKRFRRRIVEQRGWLLVCSDRDRAAVDLKRTVVVPNGYDLPPSALGRTTVGSPPNILYQGLLTYLPNVDGVTQLVEQILPRVRAVRPDVMCTLVGKVRPDDRDRWERAGRVRVTGYVPDITAELARADLVAIPLRIAGGTRLKILEAFAHQIPVVATTIAAEGLGVESGRELLIADDHEAFARACLELLENEELRERLTVAARRHVERDFQWADIRQRFRGSLAGLVAADPD